MRNARIPLLVVGCLLLTSCGQRLDSTTRQGLLQQSLRGGGTGSTTGTASVTTGAVAAPGPTGATAPGSTGGAASGATGGQAPTSTTGAPVVGGATTPQVGTTAPPGGNGGPTDVGITATSITVGTVADQTGPQPGLFDGDIAGVNAYFAYVNSQGGINGRQLKQTSADSGLDCNQTTNAYEQLSSKVFSFVGNLSLFDNCGAAVLRKHPTVPDVSFTLTPEHLNNPTTFSTQPSAPGGRTGPPFAFAATFPEVKQAVGGLYPNVAGAKAQWAQEKAMLEHLGFTVVYDQAIPPTTVDYTQYVIGMRQSGVKMAVLFNTASNNEKFINAAQQQGFTPPVIESPGTLYDPSFPAAVGTAVTDAYVDTTTALYADASEAKRVPGVALYQQWMKRVAPDQALDQFSTFGWMEAALFVQAVRAVGPRVTRQGLITALRGIHSVDTGGLLASGDPGARKPASCYLLAHYEKGIWKRFRSPVTGFICDKPYYYTGS
jgi:ABC-type branched-subunit amino acid transport system substrate-binding protein